MLSQTTLRTVTVWSHLKSGTPHSPTMGTGESSSGEMLGLVFRETSPQMRPWSNRMKEGEGFPFAGWYSEHHVSMGAVSAPADSFAIMQSTPRLIYCWPVWWGLIALRPTATRPSRCGGRGPFLPWICNGACGVQLPSTTTSSLYCSHFPFSLTLLPLSRQGAL